MIAFNTLPKLFCRYTNPTDQFQIIRISYLPYGFFERTVVPQGSILFETFQEAQLEIHTHEQAGAILSDTIPCSQLAQTLLRQPQRSHLVRKGA